MQKLFTMLLLFLLFPHNVLAMGFNDIYSSDWYYNDILEMQQIGWLQGYEDGSFKPNASISTAEFVNVCSRAAGYDFAAAQDTHWATAVLADALSKGWYDWDEIPPTGETFDQPIQRQLAVKIIMHALLPEATGDYITQSVKIRDFSQLSGRYYNAVLAAYEVGVVSGNADGYFYPESNLSRAEACAMIMRTKRLTQNQQQETEIITSEQNISSSTLLQGGVSENGYLQVIGTNLCNDAGQPIVLRGMSSHGLQWYSQFAQTAAIAGTAAYGANVYRISMYTEEGGYLSQPQLAQQVIASVEAAIQNDMYVIIDWHILSDGNPMNHIQEAKAFFSAMAKRYHDVPNVLYEICNEPNGNISWSKDVKPYAEEVIKIIRAEDQRAIILIGSPTWSQDVHLAAADPLAGNNLMYTCHFYAGTHGDFLRQRIESALQQGLPIFVSEWGCSSADGSNGVYLAEAEVWLDFLSKYGISWCNWSLCDKNESSAALKPGASPNGKWNDNDLTESGRFVFAHFKD